MSCNERIGDLSQTDWRTSSRLLESQGEKEEECAPNNSPHGSGICESMPSRVVFRTPRL
jgi:hypothetical protein